VTLIYLGLPSQDRLQSVSQSIDRYLFDIMSIQNASRVSRLLHKHSQQPRKTAIQSLNRLNDMPTMLMCHVLPH